MIGGVLYAPDAAGLIEAFDAGTGEIIWRQDPGPEMATENSAMSTRGVDFWKGGSDYRLFTVRNGYLYALDLRGKAVAAFGTGGRLNLLPAGARSFSWSSGPIVVGDVVVIAGNLDGAGDGGYKWKGSPPEDVRGFDARSGKLLWIFHVVPHDGEFGACGQRPARASDTGCGAETDHHIGMADGRTGPFHHHAADRRFAHD